MLLFDVLILQTLILLLVYFFSKIEELYQVIFNSFLFLVLVSFALYLEDFDIIVNFLIIIDLGVFIILFLFSFSIYLMFNSKNSKRNDVKYSLLVAIFIGALVALGHLSKNLNINVVASYEACWFFFISYYNYYTLFFTNLKTDLQLLREIYFALNTWEFFVVNLLILYGVIFVLYFYTFTQRSTAQVVATHAVHQLTLDKQTNQLNFLRLQDFMQQKFTVSGVRVWTSKTRNEN